jgi:hypothetical protein
MTNMMDQMNGISLSELAELPTGHGWDDLIVCRVEVDLPNWVAKLAGGGKWEVYAENEDEYCVSFAMRESAKAAKKAEPKLAEVTLYHNGHATVDVEGKYLFEGSLANGDQECAHLTYYHADSGEKITLN